MFGDIIGILDSNYNELVTYEYDSWGALVNITDNSNIDLGTINPFRYRSYYYDIETSLYYLNSRYYNPKIGRFINSDSTVSTGQGFEGNNMFVYCGNNPIIRTDTKGNSWVIYIIPIITTTIFGMTNGFIAMHAQIESNKLMNVDNIYSGIAGAFIGGAYGSIMSLTEVGSSYFAVIAGELANMKFENQSFKDTLRNIQYGFATATIYELDSVRPKTPFDIMANTYTSTYATNTAAIMAKNNENPNENKYNNQRKQNTSQKNSSLPPLGINRHDLDYGLNQYYSYYKKRICM